MAARSGGDGSTAAALSCGVCLPGFLWRMNGHNLYARPGGALSRLKRDMGPGRSVAVLHGAFKDLQRLRSGVSESCAGAAGGRRLREGSPFRARVAGAARAKWHRDQAVAGLCV